MTVEVRPAAPWQSAAKQAVVDAAWISGHGHLFPVKVENMRQGKRPVESHSYQIPATGSGYVAVMDGRLVGAIDLRPQSDGFGLIEPIAVEPSLHRRGIGTALWDHCVTVAKVRGLRGLQVWAVDGNRKANEFYEGRGCTQFAIGSVSFDGVERRAIGYQFKL